jgi:hypothetical protein
MYIYTYRYVYIYIYADVEDPEAGGETAFPKGADGLGFKVRYIYVSYIE